MSSRTRYGDENYSAASQDGADMTGGMDIPLQRPAASSPRKHRRESTRPSREYREQGGEDDEDDDGKSVKSGVSEKTANTRRIVSGTSLSPQSGPYEPLAKAPLRSAYPTQDQAPSRSGTRRPTHLEVDTTNYQSRRNQPPPSGPSGSYGRSPAQDSGQSPRSSEPYPPETTPLRTRKHRPPPVAMPSEHDFTVPSASANNVPQYREEFSSKQTTPARSGYARPLQQNTAEDYRAAENPRKGSQPLSPADGATQGRSQQERADGAYRSLNRPSPSSPGQSYQATSPRGNTTSPLSPRSGAGQTYPQSSSRQEVPDPYIAKVSRATGHQNEQSRRDSGLPASPHSKPINMPNMPSRRSRFSHDYGSGNSAGTNPKSPMSPMSPLGRFPVRTCDDGHSPPDPRSPPSGGGQSYLSPTYRSQEQQADQGNYFAARDSAVPQPRRKAEYQSPFAEPDVLADDLKIDGPIKERERAPRQPTTPSSLENSRTDLRNHSRKPSEPYNPLLSPRSDPRASRVGSATSAQELGMDAQIQALKEESAELRKARDRKLREWYTGMTRALPTHLAGMQRDLEVSFAGNGSIKKDLEARGWDWTRAKEKNQLTIDDLRAGFTKKYNERIAQVYGKYTKLDEGVPADTCSITAWSRPRESKLKGDGSVDETDGFRLTSEVRLSIAGSEPIVVQRRRSYDDLIAAEERELRNIADADTSLKNKTRDRSRQPDGHEYDDDERDGGGRRQRELTYGGARDNDYRRDRSSLGSDGRRGRVYDEEPPRTGNLLTVPKGRDSTQRDSSGRSITTTKYQYVPSREPSREPSRRGSRAPSRAVSRSRAPSKPRSRAHSRSRREGERAEPRREPRRREHGTRTERTDSEERARNKRREERARDKDGERRHKRK